jgi:amidase
VPSPPRRDPLAALDATSQAELVARGDVTPLELVDAAIARIEALDPQLNAVVLRRFEAARTEAASSALPGGPFRGVPFLTKDLACPTAGEPQTDGMRAAKDAGFVATETSHLAERFRGAGLVNLGRTNSPELGLVPTTEPLAWGATHNPWDLTRSPGGSSGGSAAAVAAGLVPFAHASDGGGSIRIPASACGLVGLKTSRGRISVGPGRGELSSFLSVQFAVTRTVRDAAALLDVAAGPEPGDPVVAPAPSGPFRELATRAPGPLRIGLMTRAPGDASPVHPECVTAVEHAAKLLESLGHQVELAHPAAYDDPDRAAWFATLWGVDAAAKVSTWGNALGRTLTEDDVEPATWVMASAGRDVLATTYLAAVTAMQGWARAMARWWTASADGGGGFDLLLTPTLAEPPAPLGTFTPPPGEPFAGLLRAGPYTPYTPTMNMTGQPAISLPLHESGDGLPIGVHLVAAYGRDDLLLALAAQLEAASPWVDRVPAVHA